MDVRTALEEMLQHEKDVVEGSKALIKEADHILSKAAGTTLYYREAARNQRKTASETLAIAERHIEALQWTLDALPALQRSEAIENDASDCLRDWTPAPPK